MFASVVSRWFKVSSVLPLILLMETAQADQSDAKPLAEQKGASIGYPTVRDAFNALMKKPGVVFTQENGWTIAVDQANLTIWSFAPKNYAAYPAVVKRQVFQRGNIGELTMTVECEATKAACDDLVRNFERMNGLINSK